MEIRKLSDGDVEGFRALRLRALKTNPEAFGSTYEREKEFPVERFLSRLNTEGDNFVVGGFVDGELVCNASFLRSMGQKELHKGTIVAMFCDEEHRGTGVAKAVVRYLIEEARKLDGLLKIDLMVVSENTRAKRFYESFGFTRYGTEPMALFDGERYLDENLMTLVF